LREREREEKNGWFGGPSQPASFLRGNIHGTGAWYGHILLVSTVVIVDTSVRV
jgi:hypothetical protein